MLDAIMNVFSQFSQNTYRKLLEGEETRFGVGVVASLPAAPSFTRPMFTLSPGLSSGAPYLFSTRLLGTSISSADEVITLTRAHRAEASLPPEDEEKEEEEEAETQEEAGGEFKEAAGLGVEGAMLP